jgi:aspartyl-tRNA(Asn)/glutamyl-tRNA(Gln) amidotransferase subunit A
VREGFRAALDALAGGGLSAAEASPPALTPLPFMIPMLECEVYETFADVLESDDHGLSPQTLAVAGIGVTVSGREYVRALGERVEFETAWRDFFASADVLLSPTTQVTAFELGRFGPDAIDGVQIDPEADGSWYPTSFIANVIGAPAVSVPCGVDDDGLPLGIQVMARPGRDDIALGVAAEIERLLPREGWTA